MRFPSRASLAMAAAALLIGVSLGACGLGRGPDTGAGSINDPLVAARVNGRPIYREDVRNYAVAHNMVPEDTELDPNSEVYQNALEALVEMRLFALEAEKRGLDRRADVQRALEMAREQVLAGVIYQDIDDRAHDQRAIQQAYDQTASRLGQGEVVHLRHIQFNSREEAEAAKRRLVAGERFEALAFELSTDRDSAAEGGDWGQGAVSDLVAPLRDLVSHTPVGSVSSPIQLGNAWHLIRVEELSNSGPPSMEDLRPQLIRWLQWEEDRKLYERLERDARIEVNNNTAAPAQTSEPASARTTPPVAPPPAVSHAPAVSGSPFPFPMGGYTQPQAPPAQPQTQTQPASPPAAAATTTTTTGTSTAATQP